MSDRFTQKKVLIVANVFSLFSSLLSVYFFTNNIFIIIIISVIFDSISRTLSSGTNESFYAVMFKKSNIKSDYETFLRKINFLVNITQIFAVLFLLFAENKNILVAAFMLQSLFKILTIISLLLIKNKEKYEHENIYTVSDIQTFLKFKNFYFLIPFIFLVTVLNIATIFLPLIINEQGSSLFLTIYFLIVLISTSYMAMNKNVFQYVVIFILINTLNIIFGINLLTSLLCNFYLFAEFTCFLYYPRVNAYVVKNSKSDRISIYFSIMTNMISILSMIFFLLFKAFSIFLPIGILFILLVAVIINNIFYKNKKNNSD